MKLLTILIWFVILLLGGYIGSYLIDKITEWRKRRALNKVLKDVRNSVHNLVIAVEQMVEEAEKKNTNKPK